MCIGCIRKLVRDIQSMDQAVVATGGSPVQTLHVVQHEGHIHARVVCLDGSRGEWDACGGTVEQLRHTVTNACFTIAEFASMSEADERGLDETVLEKLEECAQLVVKDDESVGEDTCAVCCDSLPEPCRGHNCADVWPLPCGHNFHSDCSMLHVCYVPGAFSLHE